MNRTNNGKKEYTYAQAMIPSYIYDEVKEKAQKDCNYSAPVFRRWIIEGYERDKKKGEY